MRFYIALEDLNLDWKRGQVDVFDKLWIEGYSLEYISNKFKREMDEVAILVMDRCRKEFIQPRKNGIFDSKK